MCETVNNIIVHQLHKERNEEPSVHLSELEAPVNESVTRLLKEINKKYADKVRAYGCFEEDQDNFPMGRFIGDFVAQDTNFFNLSHKMMEHLKERSASSNVATGGFVLIAYVTGDYDYILVAQVSEALGTHITNGFEITDTFYVELANLKFAGKINLTALSDGAERYISFLKGRGDISGYFRKFLGCNTAILAQIETDKLIQALRTYARTNNFSPEQRDDFLLRAHSHLSELEKNNEPLSIETLSNALCPENPQTLLQELSNEELQLSDGFIPDKKTIKKLTKFSGKTSMWSLSFSRDAFRDNEVEYNREEDVIILRNIPDKLRTELITELDP